ncbi:MAG: hypothetical protein P8I94_04645 [Emcibacteraceae bacterium]|nr:hypothetical protein [Emcibacteraceae bacterium]
MVKNFSLVTGTFFFKLIQGILVYVILARTFDVENFGFVALCFSCSIICMNIVDYGGRLFIIVEAVDFSLIKQCGYIDHWKRPKLILSLILFTITLSWSYSLGYSIEEITMLLLAVASGSLLSFANSYSFVANISNNYRLEVLVNGVFTLLVLMVCVFVALYSSALLFMCGIFGAALGGYFTAKIYFNRFVIVKNIDSTIPRKSVKEIFITSLPFALLTFLSLGVGSLDIFFVEASLDRQTLSEYLIISRIIFGLGFFIPVLAVYGPHKISEARNNNDLLKKITKKLTMISLALALNAVCFYWILDLWLIQLIFGSDYGSLTKYTYIILAIVFIKHLNVIPGSMVSVLVSQKIRVKVSTISLTVLIFSFIFLIPFFQLNGVLLGLLLSHIIMGILFIYYINTKGLTKNMAKPSDKKLSRIH